MKKGYLVLENGMVFEGERFGADKPSLGELVLTTGVVGYIETLNDPCFSGQIVAQTFPLIGNYGATDEDLRGAANPAGYIVHEYCEHPSNFRSRHTISELLAARGIPGLAGVDTRGLTRALREHGVMNAAITDNVPDDISFIKNHSAEIGFSCGREFIPSETAKNFTVAFIDCGARRDIALELVKRGCDVSVFPASARAEELLALAPDGILISEGPGDPAKYAPLIRELGRLVGGSPVFGVGLGHQLLALALGAKTVKMKLGHRGGNQPVKDMKTGKLLVTSQNHGYAVDPVTLSGVGDIRFVNVNDGGCEGVDYPSINSFSVQFRPEAGAFADRIIQSMGDKSICR